MNNFLKYASSHFYFPIVISGKKLAFPQCLFIFLSTLPVLRPFSSSSDDKGEVSYHGFPPSVPTLLFFPLICSQSRSQEGRRCHYSLGEWKGRAVCYDINVSLIADGMCDLGHQMEPPRYCCTRSVGTERVRQSFFTV